MTCNEILSSIEKEIDNVSILDDNFYCCIRDDDISKEIYAFIDKFNGDVEEFAVCFRDLNNNSRQYIKYNSVDKFIKDFKDIEEAFGKIRKITNNLVFF